LPKKLINLLAAVIILVAVAAILTLTVGSHWSALLGDRFTGGVEVSTLTRTSVPGIPATPFVTNMPATPIPNPTSGLKDLAATCFKPEQLPAFAFTRDGTGILVRAGSGVQIFSIKSGELVAFIRASSNVVSAALSPNGQILAWSLDDNTIQLVQISNQKVLRTLQSHTDTVTKLKFSSNGDFLVSASHDYSVKVWNLLGEELISFTAGALGIGISPDGSILATVPYDGPVTLWDSATGEKIKELGGTGGYDTSAAGFSPDGSFLAADLASGIYKWRISDGALVWDEVKNSMAVAFSPDGQYLAYSNIDDSNKVVLAAPHTGQFIRVIDQMQSPVWELFFSPDSSLLAVTDGVEIHVLRVEDGTLLSVGKNNCP
jgi:WD40 repeat protein